MDKCYRCGEELNKEIYIGDGILGYLDMPEMITVDLCKECHTELVNVIKNWWVGEIPY